MTNLYLAVEILDPAAYHKSGRKILPVPRLPANWDQAEPKLIQPHLIRRAISVCIVIGSANRQCQLVDN